MIDMICERFQELGSADWRTAQFVRLASMLVNPDVQASDKDKYASRGLVMSDPARAILNLDNYVTCVMEVNDPRHSLRCGPAVRILWPRISQGTD